MKSDNEYMRIFSKNLRHYMEINDKQQIDLINDLHLNRSSVSTWCNGTRLPRMDKVDMLAKYFGIDRSDLIEDKPYQKDGVQIPVLGRVAAGIPIEAVQDVIDVEEIDQVTARSGEFFALKLKGDSMEPRMCDGDVVIVRRQEDAENGDVVIVSVNGTDATCKRLKKYEGGVALVSFNSAYEPMIFSNEEIEDLPIKIWGKVVELRGKF